MSRATDRPVPTPERGAASAAPRSGAAYPVPVLADGVELLGAMSGSGYREPTALVRRADGQVIQLTPLLYLVLAAVDGRRDHAEIAGHVSDSSRSHVTSDNIDRLIRDQLLPLGFLRLADGSQPRLKKADPLLGLRFRYAVTNPAVTRRLSAPFAWLFQPLLVVLVVVAFLAVCWWIGWDKGLASATHQALYEPGLLLLVFAVTVVSAGFHELGHAAGARYGGANAGVMGMGLYLIWPAFYTDVTDSYRLGRRGRLRTDLGGLYFNAIVAVGTFGVWMLSRSDALLLVVVTQVLQMLRQLAPLVRFDGYHVLADLTGVPDLYQHIRPILLGLLPHNWGRERNRLLKPWVRIVVTSWVLTVVPLLLAALTLMVVAFPRLAATAWDSLGERVSELQAAFAVGNMAAMGATILAMTAIALPLFGMAYIVVRLVRQVTIAAWRNTEDRPLQRGLVIVLALAVISGLTWAWWPEENRYQPLRSYERGTIADALPDVARSSALTPGEVARAATVWPTGEPLPTADRPALSIVLVPRDDTGGGSAAQTTEVTAASGGNDTVAAVPGTWVFPFDRPPAPRDGDNQALAVNTTDNSVVYDVAFALVWVEEGESTNNVNSSYALASCTNCAAVSVAFQVVLVVGQSDTIVPQNLAASVNYSCIQCVTYALAKQLVLTVDEPLGDRAMSDLIALWEEIARFGRTITEVPLSEIQARLTAFEERIVEIIERDQGLLDARPSASPTASPPAGPTGSPIPGPVAATPESGESGSNSTAPSDGSTPISASPSPSEPLRTQEADGTSTAEPEPESTPSGNPTTSPTPAPSMTTSP